MYEVRLYEDPQDTEGVVIHSSNVNELKIEGSIKKEINLIDSFNFTFYLNNPGYNLVKLLKTQVKVRNTITNEYEFEGRVLSPTEIMQEDGFVEKSFLCEGELGFFHDAPQEHLEFRGTPNQLGKAILDCFNKQVEPYKRFELGRVEVVDPNDLIYVYLSAEKTAYDELMDKFVDRLGAELQIRKENGVRYLDILKRIGSDTSTEIRLSKNLISISKEVDPQDITTRLTPLGTSIKSENETSTDASEARLTIEEVNNGLPYIDRQDLIDEFGIQGKSKTWDDISLPENLIRTGRDYLNNQKLVLNQFKLSALDLSLIGIDSESLMVGNGYPVINPIMSIDETLRIVGKTIDINAPELSDFSIGDKFKTLSAYQKESNMQASRVTELQNEVSRQSTTIRTLSENVIEVDTIVKRINNDIVNADIPGLQVSIDNLNDVVDVLNQSIGDLPVYEPVRPVPNSPSGTMTPEDKIKLDNLEVYEEATHLQSGLFSASDKAKLDLVTVTSPVDLNNIVTRLVALESPE